MRRTLLALTLGVVALALTSGCSAAADADSDSEDEVANAELVLADRELDLPILAGFPSRSRDQANAIGERDLEIASWTMRYVRTRDGFEGLVAFGEQAGGELRYLMAVDAPNKKLLLLDGVGSERDAEARSADQSGAGAEAVFAAKTFDDVTVAWLRSELYRMVNALEAQLEREGEGEGGISTQSLTAGQICGLRLAIYAASTVIPFTKIPLIGKAGSLTTQFVGSFVVDAVGNAVIGNVTDAARSATAAAASGAALESVLRKGGKLVRSLGASSAGMGASFIVGAVLGADGDFQLVPGDRVEKTATATVIVHADGSRTTVLSSAASKLLPASCRQALGETR